MNIDQILENMSEAEIAQLLATDFGAELEKEAAAELAQNELVEALYAYGALMADYEVASTEELSKEASAEYNQAAEEINAVIEEALLNSGILESEDTAELHKEAQAAAAVIFEGYSDQFEKIAKSKAGKGVMHVVKSTLNKAIKKGREHAQAAGKHIKKHKIPYGVGAAGLATAGGVYAYKKHKDHEKKASEISAVELAEMIAEDQAVDAVIFQGLEKMAAKGKGKAKGQKEKGVLDSIQHQASKTWKAAKGHMADAGKMIAKHPGKSVGGALALGGIAGAGIHHMAKKKDKDQE